MSSTETSIEASAKLTVSNAAQDWDLCHECGGLCCCLYLAHDEDGVYIGGDWLPAYIDEWIGLLVLSGALVVTETEYRAGVAGVEPLHDPRLSHLPTPEGEAYRATLSAWVDVRKCQFCHPDDGCLLPEKRRAPICGEFRCALWRDQSSTLDGVADGAEPSTGSV